MFIRPFNERFLRNIKKTKACWNWIGKLNNSGYGSIKKGRTSGAHRISYEIRNGPIPKGYYVLHKCDNRICVNPDHLWIGTQSDNMIDCQKKGRNPSAYRWTNKNNPFAGVPRTESQKAFTSFYKQRPFVFIDPSGNKVEGVNLLQFCKKNNLNSGAMSSVKFGRIPHHKKWTRFIQ